jgi:hypothetical protein
MIFGLFGGNKPAQAPKQLGYEPNEATEYLMNYLQDGSKFSSANEEFRDNLTSTLDLRLLCRLQPKHCLLGVQIKLSGSQALSICITTHKGRA